MEGEKTTEKPLHLVKSNKKYIDGKTMTLFFTMTLLYTILYNSEWGLRPVVSYFAAIAVLGVLLLCKKRIMLSTYSIWAVLFAGYCVLSSLWAMNANAASENLRLVVFLLACHALMSLLVKNRATMRYAILANYIALIITAFYILFNVDLSMVGEERIGSSIMEGAWNANDIGLKMCVGFTISLYFFKDSNVRWKKWMYMIFGVLFAGIALFTGSRKALLMVLGTLVIYILLLSGKSKWKAIFIALLTVVAILVFVMNSSALYNVLGSRFQAMFDSLSGKGEEQSFELRHEMGSLGFDWFLQRPLFGYGMNNFSILYFKETGIVTYAHNNFIETLINGGLVGFALYYFIYIYALVKLGRPALKERKPMAVLLFTLLSLTLVMQFAVVSYYDTLFNCLLMLAANYAQYEDIIE